MHWTPALVHPRNVSLGMDEAPAGCTSQLLLATETRQKEDGVADRRPCRRQAVRWDARKAGNAGCETAGARRRDVTDGEGRGDAGGRLVVGMFRSLASGVSQKSGRADFAFPWMQRRMSLRLQSFQPSWYSFLAAWGLGEDGCRNVQNGGAGRCREVASSR